jgi:MFS family permease
VTKSPAAALLSQKRLPASIQVLVGAGFLVAIGYGIVAPALPIFAGSLGVGVAAASCVVSAFAVFRLVFAPASGAMIGKLGELRVFCVGLVIVAVSSAACAFAESFGQLLVLRAVGGIGSTMFTVSAAALLLRVAPPSMRGRAAGSWATGFLVGSAAGPAVGGWLLEISFRAPFVVYAVVLVVAAAVAFAALRDQIGPLPVPPVPPADAPALIPASVMRHSTFQAALTSNFLNGWTAYGVRVALVPLFVVDALHWSSACAGAALTAFAVGTAATSSVGGRWADRYGRRPPILIGLVAVAGTMCWLALVTSPAQLMFVALLSGAGTGLMNPPSNAAVFDVIASPGTANRAGPALARYQMVGDVGAIVGPVAAGMVAEQAGFTIAFGLTAAIATVSFIRWCCATETAVVKPELRPCVAGLEE